MRISGQHPDRAVRPGPSTMTGTEVETAIAGEPVQDRRVRSRRAVEGAAARAQPRPRGVTTRQQRWFILSSRAHAVLARST